MTERRARPFRMLRLPVLEGRAWVRLVLRLSIWAAVAIAWTLFQSRMRWVLAPGEIRLVFPPKLTFLGLVVALGTFQYRMFYEIAEKTVESFSNPAWQEYERKLGQIKAEPGPVTTQTIKTLEAELNRWRSWLAAQREHGRRWFVPHNEAIIVNIFALVGGLLLSVLCDITLLIVWPTDVYGLRAASTGIFMFSFGPFIAIMLRYVLVFGRELQHFYDQFKE